MTYHFRIRTACGGIVNTSQWGRGSEPKYRLLKRYPGATIIDMSAANSAITFMTVTTGSFLGLISYFMLRDAKRCGFSSGCKSHPANSVSPLLANLYMRRFVLGWKVLGYERRLDAHIVNYADDFVICCRGTPRRR